MALDGVSEKETFMATDLMNNRPRKCLGYKTPFEVFTQMTGKDYFLNGSVALMGYIRRRFFITCCNLNVKPPITNRLN